MPCLCICKALLISLNSVLSSDDNNVGGLVPAIITVHFEGELLQRYVPSHFYIHLFYHSVFSRSSFIEMKPSEIKKKYAGLEY